MPGPGGIHRSIDFHGAQSAAWPGASGNLHLVISPARPTAATRRRFAARPLRRIHRGRSTEEDPPGHDPEAGRGALGRPGARLPSVRMWCGSLGNSWNAVSDGITDRPVRMALIIGIRHEGGKRLVMVTASQHTDLLICDPIDQSMLSVDAS